MSKTVMRVLMIGLVSMLGVEAEAHYVVVRGKCYWHSLECGREDKETPDPKEVFDPTRGPPPEIEVVATPRRVELLCTDGRVEEINLRDRSVTLASGKPIGRGDFTSARIDGKPVRTNLQVQGIVSDSFFLEDPTLCRNGVPPEEVMIRVMSVEINLYCSPETDKLCFNKADEPHSSWRAERCTLPDTFSVKKLPTRGTLYDCSHISTFHNGQ